MSGKQVREFKIVAAACVKLRSTSGLLRHLVTPRKKAALSIDVVSLFSFFNFTLMHVLYAYTLR